MDYTGKIGTQANGLFAIDYDTKAGKKRALYTQFENSDARRMTRLGRARAQGYLHRWKPPFRPA